MRIPSRQIGGWAKDIADQCGASRRDRIQRGMIYRNLFLTGDPDGNPATYNKCFPYIDTISSYLYSPVELKFAIEHYGSAGAVERAKERAASIDLNRRMRQGGVDTCFEDATTWSLVKGKVMGKLLWTEDGFDPYVIQPEMMGVLREDLDSLERQEAFFQVTYLTPSRLRQILENHPDGVELMKKAAKYMKPTDDEGNPNEQKALKQIVLGGLYPYQTAGQSQTQTNRGVVDWLSGPYPDMSPEVMAQLIPLTELWAWDDARDDWTTIQFIGEDCVLEGKDRHRNIFADQFDPDNKEKSIKANDNNPLAGHHPFFEICPNRLDGYFWGRSELCNVALLQQAINARVNGINMLLRLQEKPPKWFSGSQSVNQNAVAKLNKPGGHLSDSNPNAKVQNLAPEMPATIFESLHEFEAWFDHMSGLAPILQGRGEKGVRAQGHAETLVRTASPRFKDRALLVEREIESVGGLALDLLKAKVATKMTAWVKKQEAGAEGQVQPMDPIEQSPVMGETAIDFEYNDISKDCKVVVDAHSGSPAFSQDVRSLLFDLLKSGAMKPERLVQHLHPPGEDSIIDDIHRSEAEQAAFAQAHPQEAAEAAAKKRKH